MQADIKAIAEMMREAEEEKKALAAEAKAELEKETEIDSEDINEATPTVTVDAKYVETATKLLAPLMSTNKEAYDMAILWLERNKGKTAVSPENFAKRRIDIAQVAPEPTDSRSTDSRREDALKSVKNSWDNFKKDQDIDVAKKNEQQITSIWVKDIFEKDHKTLATLEIVDVNGKKEVKDTDVSVDPTDRYYKQIIHGLRSGGQLDKVTTFDVILSMLSIAFNDPRIVWFYGPKKETQNKWLHNETIKKSRKTWLNTVDTSTAKAEIYRNGNTRIFKTK